MKKHIAIAAVAAAIAACGETAAERNAQLSCAERTVAGGCGGGCNARDGREFDEQNQCWKAAAPAACGGETVQPAESYLRDPGGSCWWFSNVTTVAGWESDDDCRVDAPDCS